MSFSEISQILLIPFDFEKGIAFFNVQESLIIDWPFWAPFELILCY